MPPFLVKLDVQLRIEWPCTPCHGFRLKGTVDSRSSYIFVVFFFFQCFLTNVHKRACLKS